MNAFNRVLLVVLLLIAAPVCTIALVFPLPILQAVGGQVVALVDFLNRLQIYVRVPLGILFALALDIIFILFLVLELRRPAAKAIRVRRVAGGDVLVGVGSIADGIKYEVDQLAGILRTRPKVSGKRGGVILELDVDIAAGMEVPQKAEQIVETVRQVVEERMGLKLARPPKVSLRTVSYPSVARVPARPKEGPPALPKVEPPAVEPGLKPME
jgi:hypothetical protein